MIKLFLITYFFAANVMATPSPSLSELKAKAFAEDKVLSERWRSFMEYVRRQDKKSIPEIKKAIGSKDWFMRDAGIRALAVVDPEGAKAEAKTILNKDPSLIVRTSSVEILKVLKDKSAHNNLWNALSDKKNFRGKQSLWIRPKIVTALIELQDQNTDKYKNLLQDSDPRIQKMAAYAIDKLAHK